MSFWGKILGGVAGFAMGGPFGAMVGAALGHAADEGALKLAKRPLPSNPADLAAYLGNKDQLFAISVIVLSAKLAKCDGTVKRAEIDAFKRVFRIPPGSLREVGELFDQARETHEGFEPFADKLGEAFAMQREVLEEVLMALFAIARADGPLNRTELACLGAIHLRLGLSTAAWERARSSEGYRPPPPGGEQSGTYTNPGNGQGQSGGSQSGGSQSGGQGHYAPQQPSGPDPYAVLGLKANATDEEVRQTWRRLVRENHPDKLVARGVSGDLLKRATAKVADINAAWDRIKRSRGL